MRVNRNPAGPPWPTGNLTPGPQERACKHPLSHPGASNLPRRSGGVKPNVKKGTIPGAFVRTAGVDRPGSPGSPVVCFPSRLTAGRYRLRRGPGGARRGAKCSHPSDVFFRPPHPRGAAARIRVSVPLGAPRLWGDQRVHVGAGPTDLREPIRGHLIAGAAPAHAAPAGFAAGPHRFRLGDDAQLPGESTRPP